MSNIEKGQTVTINGNQLTWEVLEIGETTALLRSGLTGVRRQESLANLRPFRRLVEGKR